MKFSLASAGNMYYFRSGMLHHPTIEASLPQVNQAPHNIGEQLGLSERQVELLSHASRVLLAQTTEVMAGSFATSEELMSTLGGITQLERSHLVAANKFLTAHGEENDPMMQLVRLPDNRLKLTVSDIGRHFLEHEVEAIKRAESN